jgi:hypothetical protein
MRGFTLGIVGRFTVTLPDMTLPLPATTRRRPISSGYRGGLLTECVPKGSVRTVTLSHQPNPCVPQPVGSKGINGGGFVA